MTSTLSCPSTSIYHSLLFNDDLLSESFHSEAAQVYQTWQVEDDEILSYTGVVSDEEDDDFFMQLEEDEGLLPSNLDDFYDTIAQQISSDDSINTMLFSSHEMPSNPPPASISSDSIPHNRMYTSAYDPIFSLDGVEDDRSRFQSALSKLTESMRRSQESRRSLYARTLGLRDYMRLGSVERVVQSVEFSTHHICNAMTSQ
jgi:hypothetical protein